MEPDVPRPKGGTMAKYDYPFEDFLADFDALTATTPVGDTPSHTFLRSTLNYFRAT